MGVKLVDLEYRDEEKFDAVMPMAMDRPHYPPNMRISLTKRELEKCECAVDEFDMGDIVDMRVFGVVTAVRKDEFGECVEIQIQRLGLENENNEEAGE